MSDIAGTPSSGACSIEMQEPPRTPEPQLSFSGNPINPSPVIAATPVADPSAAPSGVAGRFHIAEDSLSAYSESDTEVDVTVDDGADLEGSMISPVVIHGFTGAFASHGTWTPFTGRDEDDARRSQHRSRNSDFFLPDASKVHIHGKKARGSEERKSEKEQKDGALPQTPVAMEGKEMKEKEDHTARPVAAPQQTELPAILDSYTAAAALAVSEAAARAAASAHPATAASASSPATRSSASAVGDRAGDEQRKHYRYSRVACKEASMVWSHFGSPAELPIQSLQRFYLEHFRSRLKFERLAVDHLCDALKSYALEQLRELLVGAPDADVLFNAERDSACATQRISQRTFTSLFAITATKFEFLGVQELDAVLDSSASLGSEWRVDWKMFFSLNLFFLFVPIFVLAWLISGGRRRQRFRQWFYTERMQLFSQLRGMQTRPLLECVVLLGIVFFWTFAIAAIGAFTALSEGYWLDWYCAWMVVQDPMQGTQAVQLTSFWTAALPAPLPHSNGRVMISFADTTPSGAPIDVNDGTPSVLTRCCDRTFCSISSVEAHYLFLMYFLISLCASVVLALKLTTSIERHLMDYIRRRDGTVTLNQFEQYRRSFLSLYVYSPVLSATADSKTHQLLLMRTEKPVRKEDGDEGTGTVRSKKGTPWKIKRGAKRDLRGEVSLHGSVDLKNDGQFDKRFESAHTTTRGMIRDGSEVAAHIHHMLSCQPNWQQLQRAIKYRNRQQAEHQTHMSLQRRKQSRKSAMNAAAAPSVAEEQPKSGSLKVPRQAKASNSESVNPDSSSIGDRGSSSGTSGSSSSSSSGNSGGGGSMSNAGGDPIYPTTTPSKKMPRMTVFADQRRKVRMVGHVVAFICFLVHLLGPLIYRISANDSHPYTHLPLLGGNYWSEILVTVSYELSAFLLWPVAVLSFVIIPERSMKRRKRVKRVAALCQKHSAARYNVDWIPLDCTENIWCWYKVRQYMLEYKLVHQVLNGWFVTLLTLLSFVFFLQQMLPWVIAGNFELDFGGAIAIIDLIIIYLVLVVYMLIGAEFNGELKKHRALLLSAQRRLLRFEGAQHEAIDHEEQDERHAWQQQHSTGGPTAVLGIGGAGAEKKSEAEYTSTYRSPTASTLAADCALPLLSPRKSTKQLDLALGGLAVSSTAASLRVSLGLHDQQRAIALLEVLSRQMEREIKYHMQLLSFYIDTAFFQKVAGVALSIIYALTFKAVTIMFNSTTPGATA